MKKVIVWLLCGAALVLCINWLLAQEPVSTGSYGIFIPPSSIENDSDIGLFAHTNHLISVRGAGAMGAAPAGETPATIRAVYGLPSTGGSGIIAIVDAFDYPTAEADLNVFSAQFGLPACTTANKCFHVVYSNGSKPPVNCSWAQEAALDIQWAHAMAPDAKIVLVETADNSLNNLFRGAVIAAIIVSANNGSGQVSMSWGSSEFAYESMLDKYLVKTGVVFFAASGDTGGKTIYPGVSPNVVSAGGTRINRDANHNFVSETGWSGSGGGPSKYESRPSYQAGIASIVGNKRGAPDYSFDADPASGVSVYDSTSCQGMSGWLVFGGTSVSSPSLAGIVNLAGSKASSSAAELATIYAGLGGPNFRDITSGTAGTFHCGAGWDFVTGVGSNLGLSGK